MTWKHRVLSRACGMLTAYCTRSTSSLGRAKVFQRLTVEFIWVTAPGTEHRWLSTSEADTGTSRLTLHSGRPHAECWSTHQWCRRLMLTSHQSLCSVTQSHDLLCTMCPTTGRDQKKRYRMRHATNVALTHCFCSSNTVSWVDLRFAGKKIKITNRWGFVDPSSPIPLNDAPGLLFLSAGFLRQDIVDIV